ncbi:MAG: sigma-54-dependent Fis family transcriptional regulator [Acidobacteria bacterium]|nr:sigma-54-dependent Fis family transcriptional regulator [Acidobacteriota bacterium]
MASRDAKGLILVADDGPATVEALRRELAPAGYRVFSAASVPDALKLLAATRFDVVIANVRLPGANDLELVRHVCENLDETEVVATTNYATVDGAVQAIKAGAFDYLVKPIAGDRLLAAVEGAIEALRLRKSAGRADPGKGSPGTYGLWGDSPAMQEVIRAIGKAASISATVLVSGESGTGKELVARAIHYGSARASAPFVAVNCGAIPETLLESELFGYVKGAFTGASETRAGFFQTADGGTIFLDEISETSPSMQVKLLRVLQEKEICMVGATRSRRVDVRVVTSTNRDPQTLVAKAVLREDLFYRLNVIAVAIPPLRERGDDILLLAHHFARKFAAEFGKAVPQLSEAALRALRAHTWPGNVRELENVIQRLVVMCEGGTIEVRDLPALMRFSALRESTVTRPLVEIELDYIRSVLSSVEGNRSQAARILGIDRKTLREKLKFH